MNVVYAKRAIKVLEKLDRATKQRIKQGVDGIPKGDIKRLYGQSGTNMYRLRVGDWRIVFTYPAEGDVLIEKIAPRGEAYKE